ncbi:phosphoribosylformylglycinamidine synthase I [bacterium]|nr:phosphoribosylformylglycinamidine synthase I [bacterium]
MSTNRVALIQFPGSNCEWESKRSAEAVGLTCDVFRWNADPGALTDYDGYIIGGGFSYQDRVRSGVIATKAPIMRTVFREVTGGGKPVLGICNGAQVLIEAGLIPGLHPGDVEMGLAPNFHDPDHRIAGFCCRWVYLKHACAQGRCALTSEMPQGEVFPIPIAHGEGRFTTSNPDVLARLVENDQIVFQYCDEQGELRETRDVNPNGAQLNIAGLCSPDGNVLGMMPHPERASFLRQIPGELGGEWAERKDEAWGDACAMGSSAPGLLVFWSLAKALGAGVAV